VGAGAAGAAIVPQKSIRGVAIGDTVKKVRDKLGKPSAVAYSTNEIIGKVRSERYGLTTVRYDGTGTSAKVIQVETRSKAERVSGVGVGSTYADVKAKVAKVTCSRGGGAATCTIGEFVPGARVTTFYFNSKSRVSEVAIGLVID